MKKILSPLTILRLKRLWPHARRQGREIGQVCRIGYYCKGCGTDTIWLVDEDGNYDWTVDALFIEKFFEVVEFSKERSIYGQGRPKLGPLSSRNLPQRRMA